MSMIVDISVVAAMILGPFWVFWRIRKSVGSDCSLILSFITSLISWVVFSQFGILIGSLAPAIDSCSGDVVSMKKNANNSWVCIWVRQEGQIRSYGTYDLLLQESEDAGVVAEITTKVARRPTWWPRVLSFGPADAPLGRPEFVIKARPEKLKEILAGL